MARIDRIGAAALGTDTEAEARAAGFHDETDAPDEPATVAAEEAVARFHDPDTQFRVLNPEALEVTLHLEREVEVLIDDPEDASAKITAKRWQVIPKPIRVRYDLTPRDVHKRRVLDHFEHFSALMRAELLGRAVDVPQNLDEGWLRGHPGAYEAALCAPAVRAKGREIVALLAECDQIVKVPMAPGSPQVESKMITTRVSEAEIEEGLEGYELDVVVMGLVSRFYAEVQRRKNRLAASMGNGAAGSAISTVSSSPRDSGATSSTI